MLLLLIQRPVWRETDDRSPPDQICSIFNAEWHQGLQLQKTSGYMNMSHCQVMKIHVKINVVMSYDVCNCQIYFILLKIVYKNAFF